MKRIFSLIVILCNSWILFSQTTGRYRDSFTDKNNSKYSINSPEDFLSRKAIQRRQKQNIAITIQDIPVIVIQVGL